METVKRLVVSKGWGREEFIGRAQRIWGAVKPFYMIPQWWIYVIIHLSKPIECTTSRAAPNVNHELGVIMMCQYRF